MDRGRQDPRMFLARELGQIKPSGLATHSFPLFFFLLASIFKINLLGPQMHMLEHNFCPWVFYRIRDATFRFLQLAPTLMELVES